MAFILAVISWSYYAFVYVVCFLAVESMVERVIFLFLYHLILILFIWSYLKTIFAPKCETPPSWKLSKAMSERLVQVRHFDDFFLAKKIDKNHRKIRESIKIHFILTTFFLAKIDELKAEKIVKVYIRIILF